MIRLLSASFFVVSVSLLVAGCNPAPSSPPSTGGSGGSGSAGSGGRTDVGRAGSGGSGGSGGASSSGGSGGTGGSTGGSGGTGSGGSGGSGGSSAGSGGSGGTSTGSGGSGGAAGGSGGGTQDGPTATDTAPFRDSAGPETGGDDSDHLPGRPDLKICKKEWTPEQCCAFLCSCLSTICSDSPKGKPGIATCMNWCPKISDMARRCHVYHCYVSISPTGGIKDHDSHCGHAADQVAGGGCPVEAYK